jgi:hypothetical protein
VWIGGIFGETRGYSQRLKWKKSKHFSVFDRFLILAETNPSSSAIFKKAKKRFAPAKNEEWLEEEAA